MDHRNRWFTSLKNGGSFHGELLVRTRPGNQAVDPPEVVKRPSQAGKFPIFDAGLRVNGLVSNFSNFRCLKRSVPLPQCKSLELQIRKK